MYYSLYIYLFIYVINLYKPVIYFLFFTFIYFRFKLESPNLKYALK